MINKKLTIKYIPFSPQSYIVQLNKISEAERQNGLHNHLFTKYFLTLSIPSWDIVHDIIFCSGHKVRNCILDVGVVDSIAPSTHLVINLSILIVWKAKSTSAEIELGM